MLTAVGEWAGVVLCCEHVQADLSTSVPSSTLPEPAPANRRAAFLALPEPIGQPAYEMQADGSIIQKMAPKPRHSAVQEELLFRFRAARARRIAQAYPELRIAWPNTIPASVPDIVVYRWARRPIGADGQLADEASLPPDLAIEIVSPGQSPASVGAQCAGYLERGTGLALLVDPERQTVHLYTPDDPLVPRALHPDDRLDLGDLLPDPPSVTELFAALRPDP
jgi:Uma2 family endonuclease